MLKSQTGHCLTKSLTTAMRKQDAKQPVEGYRRQMWHRRAGHTCGGTTLVHMVYSRSRKVVCHSSRADPTAAMALSKAASLVKKSTASLSVSATAHSTQKLTPQRADDFDFTPKREANSHTGSYVCVQLVLRPWLKVTKAFPVLAMHNR